MTWWTRYDKVKQEREKDYPHAEEREVTQIDIYEEDPAKKAHVALKSGIFNIFP